jgi:biotin carboxyl carrier protein
MKLQAEIDGNLRDVTIEHRDGGIVALVDGRRYDLEVSEPEPGVYLFKHGGKVFETFAAATPGPDGAVQVDVGQNSYEVKVIDPKRLRSSGSGTEHGDGAAEIRTAMPGKVVRLLIEAGAEVEKGDGIVVVEAMKMQNELKAPKAGTVKEFLVEEGTSVSAGQVLAVIE